MGVAKIHPKHRDSNQLIGESFWDILSQANFFLKTSTDDIKTVGFFDIFLILADQQSASFSDPARSSNCRMS